MEIHEKLIDNSPAYEKGIMKSVVWNGVNYLIEQRLKSRICCLNETASELE